MLASDLPDVAPDLFHVKPVGPATWATISEWGGRTARHGSPDGRLATRRRGPENEPLPLLSPSEHHTWRDGPSGCLGRCHPRAGADRLRQGLGHQGHDLGTIPTPATHLVIDSATGPAKDLAAQPAKRASRTQPAKRAPRTQPAKRARRTQLSGLGEAALAAQPAKRARRTQPTNRARRTQPARRTRRSGPGRPAG
jgi:hypothetical protein